MNCRTLAVLILAVMLSVPVTFSIADAGTPPVSLADPEGDPIQFPVRFDLRDIYGEFPIRDQGSYGLCWSIAYEEVLEQEFRRNGEDIMLSELYAGTQAYTGDSYIPGLDVDQMVLNSPDQYWFIGESGHNYMAEILHTNGIAPVPEEDLPFDTLPSTYGDLEYFVPDPAIADDVLLRVTESQYVPVTDAERVKSMLMDGHSAYMQISYQSWIPDEDGYVVFLPGDRLGHAVNLIGWDDGYSRENFPEGSRPSRDGAWLVLNSWGHYNDTCGYAWVSYELDVQPMVTFVTGMDTDLGRNLYSYDRGYCTTPDMVLEGKAETANVFRSNGREVLEQVSFTQFFMLQIDFEVAVYLNPSESNPASGVRVSSARGYIDCPGTLTVDLDRPVNLFPGQRFAVVVTFFDEQVYLSLDTYEESFVTSYPVASSGQSFVKIDGEWVDISADGMTNLRIRAVTSDKVEVHDASIPVLALIVFGIVCVPLVLVYGRRF